MKLFVIVCSFVFLVSCGDKTPPPEFTNEAGIQFVLIQPGSMVVGKFQPSVGKVDFDGKPLPEKMVSASEEMAEKDFMPGFNVKIEKPFYIGRFEITQSQWEKLMGTNPSVFKNDSSSNHPVDNIGWDDAQRFVNKLNELDKNHHYRLPTEFEWEYAARAGATDDISWKEINAVAVLGGTTPANVGTKKSNAWGLYDMLGNVWEWTADFYNEKIFADPSPMPSGKEHVLKGASFTGDVKNATYMTHAGGPGNGFDVGLRVVMEGR